MLDYQSDQHCAKTGAGLQSNDVRLDYQSDQHCAKTTCYVSPLHDGLITSQINTAPKHNLGVDAGQLRLITSQINTAPKLSS